MNNIPLPKSNSKTDIDTTIIAIRKQLEQINSILGLSSSSEEELPEDLLRRSDVVNVVEEGNNNPVSSGAVYDALGSSPAVDVLEVGNMSAVTSNIVATKFNQILTVGVNGVEYDTGKVWYDGRKIYGVTYRLDSSTYTDASSGNRRSYDLSWTRSAVSRIVNVYGYYIHTKPSTLTDVDRIQSLFTTRMGTSGGVTLTGTAYYSGNTLHFVHQVDKSVYPVTEMDGRIVFEYIKES